MSHSIRKATEADVDAILNLASQLAPNEDGEVPEGGFLVSGYDASAYRRFVEAADHFYVYLQAESVVGFILAHSPRAVAPQNRVENLVHCVYSGEYVTVKQAAVAPRYRRQGIATQLYQFLMDHTANQSLVAAIVLEPENSSSITFHEQLGFQRLLEVQGEDELPRGVWHRSSHGSTPHSPLRAKFPRQDKEDQLVARLQYQHEIAAQLYCHEDNLNWVKIGSLLAMLVLVGGVYSFYWGATSESGHAFSAAGEAFPIYGFLLLGVLIHAVFIASLLSGMRYMMARKDAVIELERRLNQLDRSLIPLVAATQGMSLTAQVLKWFPVFSLAVWIIAAILLIVRVYR